MAFRSIVDAVWRTTLFVVLCQNFEKGRFLTLVGISVIFTQLFLFYFHEDAFLFTNLGIFHIHRY